MTTIGRGHRRSVRSSAWQPVSPGSRACVLATGSFDASVGVWRREADDDTDPDAGADASGRVDGFEGLAGTSDAAGGEQDEEDEWRFALVLDGHSSEVKGVGWSAGGHLLATCSRDKSVWVWEEVGPDDFETVAVLQEHAGDVKAVAWHPAEELLASASYDDDVRLWREDADDWTCAAVLTGHTSTVWAIEWEADDPAAGPGARKGSSAEEGGRLDGPKGKGPPSTDSATAASRQAWEDRRAASGPRLASCSDDGTIRVWRRVRGASLQVQNELSRFRTTGVEEDWVEEARLRATHERGIYSIAWSRRTGLLASAGDDGRILVYEERWKDDDPDDALRKQSQHAQQDPGESTAVNGHADGQTSMQAGGHTSPEAPETLGGSPMQLDGQEKDRREPAATEWVVIAQLSAAHGDFEINHVAWARRADRGKSAEHEEVLVSSGDDGACKLWTLTSAGL